MPQYESFHDRAGNEMTFQEFLDLCKQSYVIDKDQKDVQIAGKKMIVDHAKIEGSFAAYKISKPNSWTAIVFRGTDDKGDWAFTNIPGAISPVPPYQYGKGRRYSGGKHNAHCILVGHSLGGGIATYAAAQHGMHGATIFPAPINPVWLGLPLPPWPAKGTKLQNYVCSGEVLTVAAALSPQLRRYGKDVWIESNAGGTFAKHKLGNVKT